MMLEEIEKLCDEATPGPWEESVCCEDDIHACGPDHPLLQNDSAHADAKFIAASRTLMPKLLAVVKEAKNAQSWMERCGFDSYKLGKLFEELEKE